LNRRLVPIDRGTIENLIVRHGNADRQGTGGLLALDPHRQRRPAAVGGNGRLIRRGQTNAAALGADLTAAAQGGFHGILDIIKGH